jgi:hypothetical protein
MGRALNERIRLFVIVVVTLGWVFNLVAPAFVSSYDSNLAANGPLLLVLGSVLAVKGKR